MELVDPDIVHGDSGDNDISIEDRLRARNAELQETITELQGKNSYLINELETLGRSTDIYGQESESLKKLVKKLETKSKEDRTKNDATVKELRDKIGLLKETITELEEAQGKRTEGAGGSPGQKSKFPGLASSSGGGGDSGSNAYEQTIRSLQNKLLALGAPIDDEDDGITAGPEGFFSSAEEIDGRLHDQLNEPTQYSHLCYQRGPMPPDPRVRELLVEYVMSSGGTEPLLELERHLRRPVAAGDPAGNRTLADRVRDLVGVLPGEEGWSGLQRRADRLREENERLKGDFAGALEAERASQDERQREIAGLRDKADSLVSRLKDDGADGSCPPAAGITTTGAPMQSPSSSSRIPPRETAELEAYKEQAAEAEAELGRLRQTIEGREAAAKSLRLALRGKKRIIQEKQAQIARLEAAVASGQEEVDEGEEKPTHGRGRQWRRLRLAEEADGRVRELEGQLARAAAEPWDRACARQLREAGEGIAELRAQVGGAVERIEEDDEGGEDGGGGLGGREEEGVREPGERRAEAEDEDEDEDVVELKRKLEEVNAETAELQHKCGELEEELRWRKEMWREERRVGGASDAPAVPYDTDTTAPDGSEAGEEAEAGAPTRPPPPTPVPQRGCEKKKPTSRRHSTGGVRWRGEQQRQQQQKPLLLQLWDLVCTLAQVVARQPLDWLAVLAWALSLASTPLAYARAVYGEVTRAAARSGVSDWLPLLLQLLAAPQLLPPPPPLPQASAVRATFGLVVLSSALALVGARAERSVWRAANATTRAYVNEWRTHRDGDGRGDGRGAHTAWWWWSPPLLHDVDLRLLYQPWLGDSAEAVGAALTAAWPVVVLSTLATVRTFARTLLGCAALAARGLGWACARAMLAVLAAAGWWRRSRACAGLGLGRLSDGVVGMPDATEARLWGWRGEVLAGLGMLPPGVEWCWGWARMLLGRLVLGVAHLLGLVGAELKHVWDGVLADICWGSHVVGRVLQHVRGAGGAIIVHLQQKRLAMHALRSSLRAGAAGWWRDILEGSALASHGVGRIAMSLGFGIADWWDELLAGAGTGLVALRGAFASLNPALAWVGRETRGGPWLLALLAVASLGAATALAWKGHARPLLLAWPRLARTLRGAGERAGNRLAGRLACWVSVPVLALRWLERTVHGPLVQAWGRAGGEAREMLARMCEVRDVYIWAFELTRDNMWETLMELWWDGPRIFMQRRIGQQMEMLMLLERLKPPPRGR